MGIKKLMTFPTERDYSLVGPESAKAIAKGLSNAEWYRSPIDRKQLKQLMKRSDGPALRDTALWLSLLSATGAAGIFLWGSWWSVPVFAIYGVLYATTADSRWHECGHGTAFRTRWMNVAVYEFASFLMMRNSVAWRWSHARHHTDTIIVGRDPEISGMRPPQLVMLCLNFLGLVSAPQSFWAILRQSAGKLSLEEADYVPETERPRVYLVARIHVAIYAGVIIASIVTASILPLILVGLPRFYGIWLLSVMGLPQHLGLAEDVLDHRLNSRTVLMNPLLRFIYWNMNYHMEHHMYPMVPYHRLPELHEALKSDCPQPSASLFHAWAEIIPCVIRQLKDPNHFIRPKLPAGAGGLKHIDEPRTAAE